MRWHKLVLPTPFRLRTTNAYLIVDEPVTLIDPGPYSQQAWEALVSQLASCGLKPSDVQQVLVTHAHPDHCGLASRIHEESGAVVKLHPIEAGRLRKGEVIPYWEEWSCFGGVTEEAAREVEKAKAWLSGFTAPHQPTQEIVGSELIEGDGYRLRVIHTPGHSSGHLCFYEERLRLCWCGDLVLKNVTPNPVVESSEGAKETLRGYLDSLRLIQRMDIAQMLPGHGEPIFDHRRRTTELIEHHRARAHAILGYLKSFSRGCTPWELASILYGELRAMDIFLGVSEVVAHLESLRLQGKVFSQRKGETMFYYAHVPY